LEFPCKHCRRQTYGGLLSSPLLIGAFYQYSYVTSLTAPARCESADWDSFRIGVPSHFLLAVQEFLTSVFLEQWIGRVGPTAWPVRSRELNPSDLHI